MFPCIRYRIPLDEIELVKRGVPANQLTKIIPPYIYTPPKEGKK